MKITPDSHIIVCNGTDLLLIDRGTYDKLDKSYSWSICEIDELGVISCTDPLCGCKRKRRNNQPSAARDDRAGSQKSLSR
jgi:hypothetical protein